MILKLVKDIYCRKMWDGVERVQLWRFCKIEYGHNGPFWHSWAYFYASAFRRRRHYVFGLSVRPSVRSLKYPLLTCTWVRWSTRRTVKVLRHVRPSVRPSGEVSGHLPENAWREWPEILHADVSWPSSELISLWPWSVDFSNFGTILT